MGAAILAGTGAGIFKDIKEGVEMMVHKATPYIPRPENVNRYNELYEIFKSVYVALDKEGLYVKNSKYCKTYAE
jgi:sugar (pentulose or hexulose) kinase